jgi:hypothetical protein
MALYQDESSQVAGPSSLFEASFDFPQWQRTEKRTHELAVDEALEAWMLSWRKAPLASETAWKAL